MNYRKHLIKCGSSIKEALIQFGKIGMDAIVFVVDEQDRLIGSLTDGDVRRGLIKGVSIDDSIDKIIRRNPKFIRKGERDINKIISFRVANYRIVPILNDDDRILNVINFRKVRSCLPVDAVLMAGGRGERLLPLTKSTPKPLLMVGEKPIIEYNIDQLSLFGIDNFWISINYLGDQIVKYFGSGIEKNIKITYVDETRPLGTIGAVSQIRNFQHDYVLITNSDLLTNLDYETFFLEFLAHDADLAIVTIPYQVTIPYAVFETENTKVINFKEKPTYTYYSNGGIYLIKREFLGWIPQDEHFNTTDLMELLIKKGKHVFSYPLTGYWLDIGNHQDFEKAQIDIQHIKF